MAESAVPQSDHTSAAEPLEKTPKVFAITKDNKDIELETEKRFSERKELPIGRGGAYRKPRKYHLTDAEKAKIIATAKATGGWPNPYGLRFGLYYFQVQALHNLGDNEWHSLASITRELEKIMSAVPAKKSSDKSVTTAWRNFIDKKNEDDCIKNAKDVDGKVEQNYAVLQRVIRSDRKESNPYGRKLQQFRMSIDIKFFPAEGSKDPTLGTIKFLLNTKHDSEESALPLLLKRPKASKDPAKPKTESKDEVSSSESSESVPVPFSGSMATDIPSESKTSQDASGEVKKSKKRQSKKSKK